MYMYIYTHIDIHYIYIHNGLYSCIYICICRTYTYYIYMVNIYLLTALRCIHTVMRTKYVRYCVLKKLLEAAKLLVNRILLEAAKLPLPSENEDSVSNQYKPIFVIEMDFRFVPIFTKKCYLGRIRSGDQIQNPLIIVRCLLFADCFALSLKLCVYLQT